MINDPERLLLTQPTEQDKAMFLFYKENPDMAAIDLLGQDLAPFQRKIIRGVWTHPFGFAILARGSGKTRMMAVCASLEAMFNPGKKVGFLGPQFRTSKLAFAEFEAIYEMAPALQACVERISRQTDTFTAHFHNGAKIYALPLAADSKMSIRGIRLHTALIDEYPHVPREVLDLVINPMVSTQRNPMVNVRRIEKEKELIAQGLLKEDERIESEKNKVWGFSSAYFQYNHMYKSICEYRELAKEQKKLTGKSNYAVYVFNYKDAPEGFYVMESVEHARRTSSPISFEMEWLSHFPSDSEGFYRRSLLDSCISRSPFAFFMEQKGTGNPGEIYVMGIDPARDRDNFAICILKVIGREMRLVRNIAMNNTAYPEITRLIRKLIKDYNIAYIMMDKGGGGSAVRDMLADPITAADQKEIILDMDDEGTIGQRGRRILRLVPFTTSWIAEANHELRTSLEHKQLMFPAINESDSFIKPDDSGNIIENQMILDFIALLKEMESIELSVTKTGVLHFDTPNPHMRKDRYTSILLAHKIAYDFLVTSFQPKELAEGGTLGPGGLVSPDVAEEADWNITKVIDDIERLKRSGHRHDVAGGALTQ